MSITYGRVITLKGDPLQNEDGAAGAAIAPGMLVKGVATILPHATAGGACSATFALERSELGAGIDNTYRGSGTPDANYQVGDTVKVGSFGKGMRVLALIPSGQNITADGFLESAGDGTLRAYSSGVIIARALDTTGAVTVRTPIRIEVY